jgi:hypothetical protein
MMMIKSEGPDAHTVEFKVLVKHCRRTMTLLVGQKPKGN